MDSVGWPQALGSGADADAFEHRFRREVDYGSAACLLIARETFAERRRLRPASTASATSRTSISPSSSRSAACATIYEPRSRVVHELHGSGGSLQARKQMEANRAIFYRALERAARATAEPDRAARRTRRGSSPPATRRSPTGSSSSTTACPHHDRGSGDPRMAKMLYELVDLWPDARITLAAAGRQRGRALCRAAARRGNRGRRAAGRLGASGSRAGRSTTRSAIVSRGTNIARFGGSCRALSRRRCARSTPRRSHSAGSSGWSASWAIRASGRGSAPRRSHRARSSWARSRTPSVVFAVSAEEAEFVGEVAPGKPTFVLPNWVEAVARAGRLRGAEAICSSSAASSPGRGRRTRTRCSISCNEVMPHPLGARARPQSARRRRRPHAGGRGSPRRTRQRRRLCRGPGRVARPHPRPREPDALRRRDQAEAAGHDRRRAPVRDDAGRRRGAAARGAALRARRRGAGCGWPSSRTRSTRTRSCGSAQSGAARHRPEELRPRDVPADAGRGHEPPRDAPPEGVFAGVPHELAAARG